MTRRGDQRRSSRCSPRPIAGHELPVLIPPDGGKREGKPSHNFTKIHRRQARAAEAAGFLGEPAFGLARAAIVTCRAPSPPRPDGERRVSADRGKVGLVLEIERVNWLKPRYEVRPDRGHGGVWERRRFRETMTGEVDGERYEVQRVDRKHFVLTHSGQVLARAEAGKRWFWTISAGDSAYALRRRSAWRSEMELRSGELTVGSIRKAAAPRGKIQCELPVELSSPTQVFVGFLVLTLWNRAAASSGGAAAAAST